MDDINAVTHEPIFEPKIRYSTEFPPPPIIKPADAITITIDVTALDDCTSAVNTIPNSKSKNGLFKSCKKFCTAGVVAYALICVDITLSAKNTIPKPAKALPILFNLSFLQNISIITPINTSEIKMGSIGRDFSEAICAVIVVPIFAPMIIAVACFNDIMPAFTKPTTITVVTPELWITAVTPAPIPTLTKRLSDVLLKRDFKLLPNNFSKLSLMSLNPIKNAPIPESTNAASSKISKGDISVFFSYV